MSDARTHEFNCDRCGTNAPTIVMWFRPHPDSGLTEPSWGGDLCQPCITVILGHFNPEQAPLSKP